AGRRGAVADFRRVAHPGRDAAGGVGRQHAVGRAVHADAVAALGGVAGLADAGGAADRRARLDRIRRAGLVGAVAGLGDVADTGRAAAHRAARLHRVGGAVRTRPGAVLDDIAHL